MAKDLLFLNSLNHHVCLASSTSENQKADNFLSPAFEKDGPSPMKSVPFVRHNFSRKRDNKPQLKSYMQIDVLLIYRMISKMLGFDR
jgi:hypothetical protein